MSYDTKKLEHIEFEAHIRSEMHEIQGTKYIWSWLSNLFIFISFWLLSYWWWKSWEVTIFRTRLVVAKEGRGNTNHIFIAPSINIGNVLLDVKLYVHSSWVWAYNILIIILHFKLNFSHICVMHKYSLYLNLVFYDVGKMLDNLVLLQCSKCSTLLKTL
jgi:hypothetical protein